MAIKLERTLKNDITAEYWRLTQVDLGLDAFTVSGHLALYKNARSRKEGKEQIYSELFNFVVPQSEWQGVLSNPVAWVYNKLKTDQLTGGADV